jgi:hypothetical protein
MKLDIEGLIAQEIKIIKNKTEIVYRIEDWKIHKHT